MLPLVNVYLARERARRGDRDEAIPLMRAAVDHLFREGQLLVWGIPATGVLVETLLDRGTEGDVAEAEAAIERLAAAPAEEGLVIRDIWLLRLRALLARAHGDDVAYRDFGIATARWRNRLASKDTSTGPRRCKGRERYRIRRDSANVLARQRKNSRCRPRPELSLYFRLPVIGNSDLTRADHTPISSLRGGRPGHAV